MPRVQQIEDAVGQYHALASSAKFLTRSHRNLQRGVKLGIGQIEHDKKQSSGGKTGDNDAMLAAPALRRCARIRWIGSHFCQLSEVPDYGCSEKLFRFFEKAFGHWFVSVTAEERKLLELFSLLRG